MGLIIVTGFCLYFYILYWATRRSYLWGKSRGFSTYQNIGFGILGFLIIYLPVFWDFLPMLVIKEYHCRKDSGVRIYKTASQWAEENASLAKSIRFYNQVQSKIYIDNNIYQRTTLVSNEFGIRRTLMDITAGWVSREELEFFDIQSGRTLYSVRSFNSARGVSATNFSFDNYKFWMRRLGCGDEWQQEAVLRNTFLLLEKR